MERQSGHRILREEFKGESSVLLDTSCSMKLSPSRNLGSETRIVAIKCIDVGGLWEMSGTGLDMKGQQDGHCQVIETGP